MAVNIKITLNERLYLRDPQNTVLGKKIIKYGILLIDEVGFESFNFKKLANKIQSTEASIYRYFENKQMLLIYLVSWYWEWLAYLIEVKTLNVVNPQKKLAIIISTFVSASMENPAIEYVNESTLHQIVISESSKAYHTKDVDDKNKKGFFLNYKTMLSKVAKVILEVNPNFPYPIALASNLFEMTNNQIFFSEHLPRLTDIKNKKNKYVEIEKMLEFFVNKMLD